MEEISERQGAGYSCGLSALDWCIGTVLGNRLPIVIEGINAHVSGRSGQTEAIFQLCMAIGTLAGGVFTWLIISQLYRRSRGSATVCRSVVGILALISIFASLPFL